MLFNSTAYLIFFPIVVALFWLLPFKFRTPLLVLASYVFYMWWKPIYGVLLAAMTLVNYGAGLAIHKCDDAKKRRLLLTLSIVGNLLLLGYFKYANFTLNSIKDLFNFVGLHQSVPVLDILLPLGISFFAFEFIHYVVDVYKGGQPVRNLLQFALFASFFPSQIAGPIKRYQDFIPQLAAPHKVTVEEFNNSIELILFGLFKKVVFADSLAVAVNRCYAHPELMNGPDLWLINWAFAFQIYFDFSGYTDIARGSAGLLGFKLPLNFELPYMSGNITDFWRRWHITLGTWLREYLYIPIGGSKFGELMTLRNLVITMSVCGLWHGASAHFVVWGFYQGLLLVAHRIWCGFKEKNETWLNLSKTPLYTFGGITLTFLAMLIGWVLFRAEKVSIATTMLQKMFFLDGTVPSLSNLCPSIVNTSEAPVFQLMPLILVGLTVAQFGCTRLKTIPGILPDLPQLRFFKPAYLAALILLLLVLSPDVAPSFIYFQC